MNSKDNVNSKDNKCAPNKKYINGSCFTLKSLKLIANKYNNKYNNKINITNNKIDLVNQLTNVFSKSCSSQICWLRLDVIKELNDNEINTNTFRPDGPSKKYEWLSTTHINDVINQYEDTDKNFVFLGALPNDFAEIPILGLSNINFNEFIESKKFKIGLVINLDTHKQSGSHWVALYIDLLKNQLYYFDSVGKKPGKRIKKFNNHVLNFMYKNKYNKDLDVASTLKYIMNDSKYSKKITDNLNKFADNLNKFDIRYNKIQHQFGNTECGVYSINFILRLVNGETFDNITKKITTDNDINKCRKVYFNN